MSRVKLIGRPIDYYGKPLMQILLNLKNFGVGRFVLRSYWERYKEKSYYKIVKVEPHMDEENRVGHILAEKVFRGRNYGIHDISSEAFKADFQLVPKHNEEALLAKMKDYGNQMRVFPREVEPPPLLKMLLTEEKRLQGEQVSDLKFPVKITPTPFYRMAEPGETSKTQFSLGLGKPASPHLYDVSYFDLNSDKPLFKEIPKESSDQETAEQSVT